MLDDDIREALLGPFREEAGELLAELETILLELEEKPDDGDLIARAFRVLHTIKGNGAMFGFNEIETFAHDLERIFDILRNGEARVSRELIDLTLAARDQINLLLKGEGEDPASRQAREGLLDAMQVLLLTGGGAGKPKKETETPAEEEREETIYRIRFRPSPGLFLKGGDFLQVLRGLREAGPCRIMALTDEVPPLEEMDPSCCHLGWDIVLSTAKGDEAVREIFSPVAEDSELAVDPLAGEEVVSGEAGARMLGQILVERGDLSREDLDRVLQDRKPLGEVLVELNLAPPRAVESALVEQQAVRDLRARRRAADQAATIRVHSHKLDGLVDLVGELVTVQARLSRLEAETESGELTSIAEEIERLTWELRDSTFSIRMVPIGTTFSRFRRMTRDLAHEMGREVELVTEGAETELDKTVIEKLNDPLVHLIRNSIGHGIESPAVRENAGKPRRGTVRLSASQSGADILIEIGDDGTGLDAEAILSRAKEKGIVEESSRLSEKEILSLIFLPGFSTARQVDNVSGRGVGMDVVKTSIESLQGTVEISSEPGQGTTIAIRLPLTLAIIEGLEVAIGGDRFVMPLSYVEECVELQRNGTGSRRNLTNVRGELVPYVRLRDWFRVPGDAPPIEQTVITRTEDRRVGLVVDYVVGEHQTVIKSLGKLYRGVNGFSGATILGDGKVALLLDVPHLVRGAEEEETALFGQVS
jgi:two-component system chemotaxis sensor kinase CheA